MQHVIVPESAIKVGTLDDAAYVSAITGTDYDTVRAYMGKAVTLLSRHCVFFLEPLTSSILEGHLLCAKEGRGKEALAAAKTALGFAFDMMGAAVVIGRVPVEDRPARLFSRLMGMKSDGVRPREPHGPLVEWFEMRGDA